MTGTGALLVGSVAFSPSPTSAAADVTWSPAALNEEIPQGQTKRVPVSFTADAPLSNVVLRVVPELEAFVQVSPISFSKVPSGAPLNITVIFSSGITVPPGRVVGTIQLRNAGKPGSRIARPLPVVLTVLPSGLPPDPGEAGKATLGGVDVDGDGVRDDVQRYIAFTYPDSAKARAAVTVLAKVFQVALLNASDKAVALDQMTAMGRAMACLYFIRPTDARTVANALRAEILNTRERSLAYLTHDEQLAGEIFPIVPLRQRKAACAFNPDLLPD